MSTGRLPASINDDGTSADVLIVGGGISGSLTAAALGRARYSVCVIDRYPVYPPDFRAEHLDGSAVDQLSQLGFLDDLTRDLYRGETVTLARFGRIVGSAGTINYGLRYETLVNRARASMPAGVRRVTAKVSGIETSDTLQQVHTSDGRSFRGRIVVVATGRGLALSKQLGIKRRMIREAHSLTFGFNIEPIGPQGFAHSFVVYQREAIRDRMDYLAAFTLGDAMRINLFNYRDYKEAWTKAMLAIRTPHCGGRCPASPGWLAPIGRRGRSLRARSICTHRRTIAATVWCWSAMRSRCPAPRPGWAWSGC